MSYVIFALKSHSRGYPKIAVSTEIENSKTKAIIDDGHNLDRNPRKLTWRLHATILMAYLSWLR